MRIALKLLKLRSVQKGYERIKEVSHRVAENEKVQQGVEKVQKGLEVAKDCNLSEFHIHFEM